METRTSVHQPFIRFRFGLGLEVDRKMERLDISTRWTDGDMVGAKGSSLVEVEVEELRLERAPRGRRGLGASVRNGFTTRAFPFATRAGGRGAGGGGDGA